MPSGGAKMQKNQQNSCIENFLFIDLRVKSFLGLVGTVPIWRLKRYIGKVTKP